MTEVTPDYVNNITVAYIAFTMIVATLAFALGVFIGRRSK